MAFTIYRPEDWSDALPKIGEIIANSIKERYERPRQEFIQALTMSAQLGTQLSEEDFASMAPNAHAAGMYSSYSGSLSRVLRQAKMKEFGELINWANAGVVLQPAQWASMQGLTEQDMQKPEVKHDYQEYIKSVQPIVDERVLKMGLTRAQIDATKASIEMATKQYDLSVEQMKWAQTAFLLGYEQQERFKKMDAATQQAYMDWQVKKFVVETKIALAQGEIQLLALAPDPIKVITELGDSMARLATAMKDVPSDVREGLLPMLQFQTRRAFDTAVGYDPTTGRAANPYNVIPRETLESSGVYSVPELKQWAEIYKQNPDPSPRGRFWLPEDAGAGAAPVEPPTPPAPTTGEPGAIRQGLRAGGTALHNLVFGPRGAGRTLRPGGAGETMLPPPAGVPGLLGGIFGAAPGVPTPGTVGREGTPLGEVLPPEPATQGAPPIPVGVPHQAGIARAAAEKWRGLEEGIGPILRGITEKGFPPGGGGTQVSTGESAVRSSIFGPTMAIAAGLPFQLGNGEWVQFVEDKKTGARQLVPIAAPSR